MEVKLVDPFEQTSITDLPDKCEAFMVLLVWVLLLSLIK